MRRLPRFALPLAPALLAAGLLGPWAGSVRGLQADPGAVRLIEALALLAPLAGVAVAVLAAHFHQVRLTLAASLLAACGLLGLLRPEWLEGPGPPAVTLGLALTLALGARLPERGVTSRAGLRGLALSATLAALPAAMAHARPDDLARLLAALGEPIAGAGLGLSGFALGALVLATLLCWRPGGRDADVLGPAFASAAACSALALQAPGLGAAIALLAATASCATSLVIVAWRRGFVDDLTQLPGRRALDVALDGLAGAYVIAVLDVDRFKRFNDEHGHDAGDEALRIVAGVLRSLRGGTAYRQGGEEFVAILPGASMEDACEALEELREAIEGTPLLLVAGGRRRALRVTASIGVASGAGAASRQALRAADQALLRAKKLGRNRIEVAPTERARSSRTARAPREGGARRRPAPAAARDRGRA